MASPTEFPPPSARGDVARAARRAGLSRYARYLVAAFAVAVFGVFLYQAGLYAYLAPAVTPPSPHVENPGQITSYESTLTGKDKAGRPYNIVASRGWQDKDLSNLFHLEKVDATLHRGDAPSYRLTSNTAVYDSHTKIADVEGAVTISQDKGFTAQMDRARIDMGANELTSDSAVRVTTGQGTVAANGLKITDDGTHILFFNGVKAHFDANPA